MTKVRDNKRTGGQILVDQLRVHGVERAFCVPGESYLAVLDAFYDASDIQLVVCRQEGGAAMMAEAHGKLTGAPGIVFATRGPGATNASPGVHIAHQDSTPMILFLGQVARSQFDREAFQEIDYRRMFGDMTKWVAQIEDSARIPEYVSRAFHTAVNGRPGPVVLALPEDMLRDRVAAEDMAPYREVQASPSGAELEALRRMMLSANRPLAIVGGGGWDRAAVEGFQRFAEAFSLPTGTSFRAQSHFNNRSRVYVGDIGVGVNPELGQYVKDADLVLAVGARLGELTTSGYTLLVPPKPKQKLIHIHPGAEELGRVYQPDLPINAGMKPVAAALAALSDPGDVAWSDWLARGRDIYQAWIRPDPVPGAVQMGDIWSWLRERLPDDAIVTNGAGNYSAWMHKNYQFRQYRTLIGPTSGSMGYGVPSAVAAKLLHPDRIVVSQSGDGCFLMNGQELATAVQYGAAIVYLVVNNGAYGTIRMHQERDYPGRTVGTDLSNPDFAALARAYGAQGETVSKTEEFEPAFERALAAGGPALIDIQVDPDAITPRRSLTQIREAALADR